MFHIHYPIIRHILIALCIASFFSGCAALDPKPAPPDQMLKDAIDMIKADNLSDAIEHLNSLLQEYPDSPERVEAQILLADSHYSLKQYPEAKFHFQRFLELYPVHRKAAHALYFMGMCDYMVMDISTRDQTFAKDALKSFERLIQEHPNSSYAERGRARKAECLRSLAQNQLEIGKYYFRTSSYQAAINRLKRVLVQYPDQGFNAEVIFLIGESYYNEESFSKAREYFMQLVDEYPRSPFVQEARARLRKIP